MKFRSVYRILAGVAALALLAGCGSSAPAASKQPTTNSNGGTSQPKSEDPAAFYKGKTLTIIVPYGPGGGYDAFGRLVAQYIKAPLGVANVVVKNVPGGGGLIGSNQIYSATPDGLTIGDTNGSGDVWSSIFQTKGVSFKVDKFNWLGRPDNEVQVIVSGSGGPGAPKGGYTSWDQIMAAKKAGKTVDLIASGVGSSEYYGLITQFNAFQIPFHMIAAYSGSKEAEAGLLRGDGSITTFGYGSLRTLITGGKVHLLAQQAATQWSVLSSTPTVLQEAQKYNLPSKTVTDLQAITGIIRMGHTFAAPPGIPADRLAFLENAFKEAVTNPAFVAQANKEHRYPQYATPQEVQQEVQAGIAAASDLQTLGTAH